MKALLLSAVFGVVMMLAGLFMKRKENIAWLAILSMCLLFLANLLDLSIYGDTPVKLFHGMLAPSQFAVTYNAVIIGCTLIYLLLSSREIIKVGAYTGEYFALIFFILCGIMLAGSYGNLLMLFLAIEIMAIPQYILVGSQKHDLKSNEASLKYFLTGAFSTGFMLLGIVLIYGATGTFDQMSIDFQGQAIDPMALAGVILLTCSLAFKVSAAPFHFWTPDVYDGSPTVFTSLIATVVKAGAFIAFIRMFQGTVGTSALTTQWTLVISIITAATLIVGNITAVFQTNVKRMLAYSSIAQAGFMLFAVFGDYHLSLQGILIYAAGYCLATIGSFAILLKMKDYSYDGFNGLAKKHPGLAALQTIFLLSLVGIPATAGFMGKYFMLSAAVAHGHLMWLVLIALFGAAISAYYYFRVIWAMYFKSGNAEVYEDEISPVYRIMLIVTAALIVLLGIFPGMVQF